MSQSDDRRWGLLEDYEDPGELNHLGWWTIIGPPVMVGGLELAIEAGAALTGADWYAGHIGRAVALCAGIALGWFLWHRSMGAVRAAHHRIAARRTDLATLRAVTEERGRLGRELHDGAAQVLAYLLLKIDTIADLVQTGRNTYAGHELEQLRITADQAYQEARNAVVDLRTDIVRRGIASGLRSLCDQMTSRSDVTVNLYVSPISDRMRPTVQLQAYQIAREALANVRSHAEASQVRVRVDAHGSNAVLLSIQDDGVGFDPAAAHVGKRRFGLHTMRERAESVGGRLAITAQRGKGTMVVAELPLDTPVERDDADDDAAAAG